MGGVGGVGSELIELQCVQARPEWRGRKKYFKKIRLRCAPATRRAQRLLVCGARAFARALAPVATGNGGERANVQNEPIEAGRFRNRSEREDSNRFVRGQSQKPILAVDCRRCAGQELRAGRASVGNKMHINLCETNPNDGSGFLAISAIVAASANAFVAGFTRWGQSVGWS